MSSYARNRDYFGKLSGVYRVQASDTGLIALIPAPLQATIYVQKLHIEVTTLGAGELWTFQDGAGVVIKANVSAGAVAHFDVDFGPDGVPCTQASAFVLNISGGTGAIGWITWEAWQFLTPKQDYASLILASSPLGYWRFEEPGSNIFYDSSGNFRHAFGGANGITANADMTGVTFRQPSALRDGTFGVRLVSPAGLELFPVTITVSPAIIAPSGLLTVTWAGIPATLQAATNWIVISKAGRTYSSYIGWKYITNSGSGSMTMSLTEQVSLLPPDPGVYDVRLLYQNTYGIMQQLLGQLVVSASGPVGGPLSSQSPTPLVLGTTCTFECAFTLHSITGSYAFIIGDQPASGLFLNTNAGLFYVDLYYGATDHRSSAITLETKYHLAVVCAAGNVTFYLNGLPAGTAAGWGSMTLATMFNNFPTGPLGGNMDIDELVVYGSALKPETIAAHAAFWR